MCFSELPTNQRVSLEPSLQLRASVSTSLLLLCDCKQSGRLFQEGESLSASPKENGLNANVHVACVIRSMQRLSGSRVSKSSVCGIWIKVVGVYQTDTFVRLVENSMPPSKNRERERESAKKRGRITPNV